MIGTVTGMPIMTGLKMRVTTSVRKVVVNIRDLLLIGTKIRIMVKTPRMTKVILSKSGAIKNDYIRLIMKNAF